MSGADVEEGMKVCTKCKEKKPRSEFGKNARTLDGLMHRCKTCVNTIDKKRRDVNKLKNANGVDMTGTKVCGSCKKDKSKNEFYKCASARDGLSRRCKPCDAAANRQARLVNKLKNANGGDMSSAKICSKCDEEKPRSEFYKSSTTRDGVSSWCKSCDTSARRQRCLANKLKNTNSVDVTGVKVCSMCKLEKPKSEFYKNAVTRDGLMHRCKSCASASYKQRRLANKLKSTRDVDMTKAKICTKCKEKKPKNEFYKDFAARDGLASWCKSCVNASDKERRLANKLKYTHDIDTAGTKTCSQCCEEKGKTEFSVNRAAYDGLRSRCKECDSRYRHERVKRNRSAVEMAKERHEVAYITEKYCLACGKTKSSNDFYKSSANEDGLGTYCKKCKSQQEKSRHSQQSVLISAFSVNNGNRWSSEDDHFVIENHGAMTEYQMAIELGRTLSSVHSHTRKLRRSGKLI